LWKTTKTSTTRANTLKIRSYPRSFHVEHTGLVVVGGGHAGCEAAAAAANLGSRVLLVTMNMGVIGQMSCNPAMGGVAKGQIVREVDALGGYSGIVSDRSTVQFRMLNRSKGPAMWSPRSQNDRNLFASEWRRMLEQTPNVHFWQDSVNRIEADGRWSSGRCDDRHWHAHRLPRRGAHQRHLHERDHAHRRAPDSAAEGPAKRPATASQNSSWNSASKPDG
jgi:hypothetical protein